MQISAQQVETTLHMWMWMWIWIWIGTYIGRAIDRGRVYAMKVERLRAALTMQNSARSHRWQHIHPWCANKYVCVCVCVCVGVCEWAGSVLALNLLSHSARSNFPCSAGDNQVCVDTCTTTTRTTNTQVNKHGL